MDALAFVHHFWQVSSLVHVGQLKNYQYQNYDHRYRFKAMTRCSNFLSCYHKKIDFDGIRTHHFTPLGWCDGRLTKSLQSSKLLFKAVHQKAISIMVEARVSWWRWFDSIGSTFWPKNSTIWFFFHKWRRFGQSRASTCSSFFFQVSTGLIEGLLTLIWA